MSTHLSNHAALELYPRLDPSALTRSTLHAGHCCTLEEGA